jgi:hypothetical protein
MGIGVIHIFHSFLLGCFSDCNLTCLIFSSELNLRAIFGSSLCFHPDGECLIIVGGLYEQRTMMVCAECFLFTYKSNLVQSVVL